MSVKKGHRRVGTNAGRSVCVASSVPHWCKQIPSRLDIPWALHDLQKHAGRKQMIRALFVVVDEIYMASEQMENVPNISKLHGELLRWYGEEYE